MLVLILAMSMVELPLRWADHEQSRERFQSSYTLKQGKVGRTKSATAYRRHMRNSRSLGRFRWHAALGTLQLGHAAAMAC